MTDTPTADEIARWAALADVHVQCETITGFLPQCRCGGLWPCATGEALSGLLALVAAQAEQIANLRESAETAVFAMDNVGASYRLEVERREDANLFADAERNRADAAEQRADKAEAELAALHATDDFQRWAQAVVERDAAREAVGRVRALCDESDAKAFSGTAIITTRLVRAALEGGAAT